MHRPCITTILAQVPHLPVVLSLLSSFLGGVGEQAAADNAPQPGIDYACPFGSLTAED